MKFLLFPLLLLCTASLPAQTVPVNSHQSAMQLRDLCKDFVAPTPFEHPLNAGLCAGYVQGAVDGFYLALTRGWVPTSEKACILKQATMEELVRVILKFIDNHPEQLSYSAADVAWDAMTAAYPCPAKTSP